MFHYLMLYIVIRNQYGVSTFIENLVFNIILSSLT